MRRELCPEITDQAEVSPLSKLSAKIRSDGVGEGVRVGVGVFVGVGEGVFVGYKSAYSLVLPLGCGLE